jgi:hypothetical protein
MIPTWFQRGSKTAPTWCQHGSHSEVRLVSWDLTVRFRCRCRCCCCSCSCCCCRRCCCCRCRRRRCCCCCCCRHRRRRHCHCRCRCRCRRCRRRSWCFLRRKKAMLRCQITPEKWNPSTKKSLRADARNLPLQAGGAKQRKRIDALPLCAGGETPQTPLGAACPLSPPRNSAYAPQVRHPKNRNLFGSAGPPFFIPVLEKKRG